MKEIIFIYLISHAISVYYIKKKHGSVKVSNKEGIVYLNADKFGKNDKIHMQFNAYRSHVDDKIYYEFSDNIPTDTFQPSIGKKPDSSWSSSTGGDENNTKEKKTTYKTNYDIKKNVSKKYLVIKYSGYYNYHSDGHLKIENTLINWGEFFLWLIISVFILIFLVIGFVILYCKFCKNRCKSRRFHVEHVTTTELSTTNDNVETPPQEKDIFYEPSNRENAGQNYDSNSTIPQQQNAYYEPPKIENAEQNYDSNSTIPQQQNIYSEPPNSAIDNNYPNKNNY